MSILKVNSIQPMSAGSQDYAMCKAWVNWTNYNAATSVPAIRQSFKVSSLTDITTNTTEVNLTNAMSTSGYSVTATQQVYTYTTHTNAYAPSHAIMSTSTVRQIWYSSESDMLCIAIFE